MPASSQLPFDKLAMIRVVLFISTEGPKLVFFTVITYWANLEREGNSGCLSIKSSYPSSYGLFPQFIAVY